MFLSRYIIGVKNTKSKPPEQVHGGTFDVEVGSAYPKGSGVKPDAHNANVRVLDKNGKTKDAWREVSGEATDAQKELGTGVMRQSTHTEQKALTRKVLDDETVVITGQRAPCKNCQGAMRNATVDNNAKVEYQWRDKVNGKDITQKEVWQNGKKIQKRKK